MKINSFWYERDINSYPALSSDIDCDALVIGGGLAGLFAAYYLTKSGVKTIVIECDTIGSGASDKMTAHITSQHDLVYSYYRDTLGHIKCSLIAKANEEAISDISNIIQEENIDCNFERASSYLFTSGPRNIIKLKEEANALSNTIIKYETNFRPDKVPFEIEGYLKFFDQAVFNPVPFIAGLAESVIRQRGKIFENTRAIKIDNNTVTTSSGHKITTQNIIIATNYPLINKTGLYFTKLTAEKAYVAVYDNCEKLDGIWCCMDDNGLTYRNYKNYLIVCGQDHRTGQKNTVPNYHALDEYVKKYFPKANLVAKWSNQDCMTPDKLPYCGRHSKKFDNLYVITGFNKWGTTHSNTCGKIIADLINNKPNAYADIFDPARKKSFPALLKNIGDNAVMAGYLISGIDRRSNPTCPHLKCKTQFNYDDNTWDCPCHGSRFDLHGNVIFGPSNHNLDSKDIAPPID